MKPALIFFVFAGLASCSQPQTSEVKALPNQGPPPAWVFKTGLTETRLCGIGIAGPGYPKSPYPKELARERSVENLAGALATHVSEAMIDHTRFNYTSLQAAHRLVVDENLLENVSQKAKTTYWFDSAGIGPFLQPGFTYAHSCIETPSAVAAIIPSPPSIGHSNTPTTLDPKLTPQWLKKSGRQGKNLLCAIGFSGPTFYPDQTFSNVVRAIRLQLKDDIRTLVSSYQEDRANRHGVIIEAITVASTEAISKGAVVSHYWYDKLGIGPFTQKESTYGWGCIYPVDVVAKAIGAVQKKLPEEKRPVLQKVRKRAHRAFEELDNEIETRTNKGSPQAPKL